MVYICRHCKQPILDKRRSATCSQACHDAYWEGKYQEDVNTPGRRPAFFWFRIRQDCFNRDNNRCRACGYPGDLEAHHIVPVSEGGDNTQDNLITLCSKCHDEQHSRHMNIKRKHVPLASFGVS